LAKNKKKIERKRQQRDRERREARGE